MSGLFLILICDEPFQAVQRTLLLPPSHFGVARWWRR
jgi:hypothetical protein